MNTIVDIINYVTGKQTHRTYVTSDLHLGHENIIKYCNRPFANVTDMNQTIIKNWNNIIHNNDTVYFLGDLSYKNNNHWIHYLNGNIIFIKGNHDKQQSTYIFYNKYVIKYKGQYFYLTHRPEDIPDSWHGWGIHGHVHNKYPFMNTEKKRFNVSIEVTNYCPVNMDKIIFLTGCTRNGVHST